MNKSPKLLRAAVITLLGMCLLAAVVIGIFLVDWASEIAGLEARMASDPDLVEFGDASSIVIAVTPDEWFTVGSSAHVDELLVSVEKSQRIANTNGLDPLPEGWVYWLLEVTIQNTSKNETIWVRPKFDSRIQGMSTADGMLNFRYNGRDFQTTDRNMTDVTYLGPGQSVQGTLIYEVLRDGGLYWIYGEGNDDRVVFKVR